MEEVNNMENLEDTIPQEVPSAEPTQSDCDEGAPQPESVNESETGSENVQSIEEEPFLPISYNHESIGLSKADAVKYAQLGMKYEKSGLDVDALRPIYNKLDFAAALHDTSIESLVDGIIANDEAKYREELEMKFGQEENEVIEQLIKVRREGQKEKYEKLLSDRKEAEKKNAEFKEKTLQSRLTDEFIELKAEFPEIQSFASLPKEVVHDAVGGRDLLSAYLRYRYNEDKKISAAERFAEQANNATTGSGGSPETEDEGIMSAILNGLWN